MPLWNVSVLLDIVVTLPCLSFCECFLLLLIKFVWAEIHLVVYFAKVNEFMLLFILHLSLD